MTTNWIPGYLGTIKLGALGVDDISPVSNVVGLTRSKNDLGKPHFGSGDMERIGGMRDSSLDCSGHVVDSSSTPPIVGDLNGYFEGDALVEFEWQLGTPTSGFDAGVYTGFAVMTALNITTDAEDEYEWTFTLAISGALTYTAGQPAP